MNCIELIVYLHSNGNDSDNSFRTKLTEDCDECVKIFIEIDSCLTFLQTNLDKMIFFVVSASFGSKIIPLICDYKNIYQIYLFCSSIESHTNWPLDYTDKKILMFDHEDDLLRRLFKEMEEYLRQEAQVFLDQAEICKDRAQLLKQPCG